MRANAVNLATFANVSYHLNATPLSVATLAPCAWGKNLACGGAWQGVVNSAMHSAQQIQCGKCLRTKRCTATRQIRLGKRGKMGGACGRSGQSENWAVFGRRTSLSLSLVVRTFWHTKIFKRFIFGILRFILCEKISKPKFK